MSRLTCGYEYRRMVEASESESILAMLREGETVEVWAAPGRSPWNRNICDWCGEKFAPGEVPVDGYQDQPTHRKCQREARRAFRVDNGGSSGLYDSPVRWEPPEINYPNGQGVFI